MNSLAKVAVVFQLIASIVASVFLIGFFAWTIAVGIDFLVGYAKQFGKVVRKGPQAVA